MSVRIAVGMSICAVKDVLLFLRTSGAKREKTFQNRMFRCRPLTAHTSLPANCHHQTTEGFPPSAANSPPSMPTPSPPPPVLHPGPFPEARLYLGILLHRTSRCQTIGQWAATMMLWGQCTIGREARRGSQGLWGVRGVCVTGHCQLD